jgi:hypothetical protein
MGPEVSSVIEKDRRLSGMRAAIAKLLMAESSET